MFRANTISCGETIGFRRKDGASLGKRKPMIHEGGLDNRKRERATEKEKRRVFFVGLLT